MDQELKQRLIGAAVITALAAIFVPMLFDDPVDETGKSISELKIPELPAKAQEVEIMPLPERVEDVVSPGDAEKNAKPLPALVDEGDSREAEAEAPHPRTRLSAKEAAPAVKQQHIIEPDEADVQADADAPVDVADEAAPAPKTTKLPVQAAQTLPAANTAPKVLKSVSKAVEAEEPAAEAGAGTRWYLNAGSFGKKANALSLQETLKQQGFAASIKEVTGEKGTVFKVRIGPMLDKAKAQAVKNKLTQINVNSFVAPDE